MKETAKYLEKVKRVHGNEYNYSLTEYINANTKIIIICNEHGEFEQRAYAHLSGAGCPKCGTNKAAIKNTKTKEDFIDKSNKLYNEKYNYDCTNYVNRSSIITIMCPEHGKFSITPDRHLSGTECPECTMKNAQINIAKVRGPKFINKSKKLHKNKYDYSLVRYRNSKLKVKIICPCHGIFEQMPNTHLIGSGCPKCGTTKTTEQFIKEAQMKHNNKFDYSSTEYTHSRINVDIICKLHGAFKQNPSAHLMGSGCPKCVNLKNTQYFVEKSNIVHDNKYDYSKVEYISSKSKVIMICPEHGEFIQMSGSHLSGAGCPKCARTTKTIEQFIEESRTIHGEKFDYSKSIYVNTNCPLIITCKTHGDFKQTPKSHVRGSQCPKCAQEFKSWNYVKKYTENSDIGNKPGTFYKLLFTNESGFQFIKVGITSKTIKQRYSGIKYNDFSYIVLEEIKCNNLESALLEQTFKRETELKKFKFPKSVSFEGYTECYEVQDNQDNENNSKI